MPSISNARDFIWIIREDQIENEIKLFYGLDESGFIPISFACKISSGTLRFHISNYDIDHLLNFSRSKIIFSNSTSSLTYPIEITQESLGDQYDFTGTLPYSSHFLQLLKGANGFKFEIENVALADSIPAIPYSHEFDVLMSKCNADSLSQPSTTKPTKISSRTLFEALFSSDNEITPTVDPSLIPIPGSKPDKRSRFTTK
ncbi:hypothetical protein G3A39_43370 [Paraburkholderia aspalathi]|nr:hypothetical protein [Paraburkholderia aspalathi]